VSQRRLQLDWEARWALPTALAAFAAIGFVIAAIAVVAQVVGGTGGDSELLRHVDEHRSAELISSILQAIGVGLLAAPLYYLFRSAKARSESMRGQLVGVVIAAPLFLAVLALLSGISTLHAASDFVSNEVPRLMAKGVALNSDHANEIAKETISEAPLRSLAAGFGLGGQLGFLVAMIYTCLYGMRVGLLPRFWGSLGIALGAVSFIFFQFAMLWFVYLGLLLIGRIPGGKPPAWESGEAIPWPSPGEKAAADLSPQPEGLPEENGELESPAEDQKDPTEKGQSQ
jgi:MFS family permease